MDLVDALRARGTVAVVGAGGKKTTIYALAGRLDRAVVTATVRIPIFDDRVARVAVTDDPARTVATAAAGDWPLGVVPERERRDGGDRYRGYDPVVVDDLAAAVGDATDAVLVKADGARSRWLKAPDEREPQVPAGADTVVPVASARVVGRPLDDDRVHRPERVADLTGRSVGEPVRPGDVAAVLASPRGGLKDVPTDAAVVALVNMVDDSDLADIAREVAHEVHERARGAVDRVVLAKMDEGRVVDVVD